MFVIDLLQDGRIDYNEFVAMMQGPANAGAKKGLETSFSVKFREAIKIWTYKDFNSFGILWFFVEIIIRWFRIQQWRFNINLKYNLLCMYTTVCLVYQVNMNEYT